MLTLQAVADRYGVDASTVRGWIRQGLPAFRAGRVVRIDEDDLERFRRLHTWSGEDGARGASAVVSFDAASASTSTGEWRSRSAPMPPADGCARSSRAGRRKPPARSSGRPSLAPIVAFHPQEPA